MDDLFGPDIPTWLIGDLEKDEFSGPCQQAAICTQHLSVIREKLDSNFADSTRNAVWQGCHANLILILHDLLQAQSQDRGCSQSELFPTCTEIAKSNVAFRLKKIWNDLPNIFGLASSASYKTSLFGVLTQLLDS